MLLSPRMLGLHLLTLVALAATVLLGMWQFGVWQHHREDTALSLVHAKPVPLDSVLTSDAPFPAAGVGRPVSFAGTWLPSSTLYVTDRVLHGRRGVWAVTPVAVCAPEEACGKKPAILVVRGWARSVAAAPAPPRGRVRVTGWLQPGEGTGLTDPDPRDDLLPELRIASAIQHVDQDLYGGYVIAKRVSPASATGGGPASGPGLQAVTPASLPQPSSTTALRNLLYALQWWVFTGFAVFLWVRWCRDEVTRVTGVGSDE